MKIVGVISAISLVVLDAQSVASGKRRACMSGATCDVDEICTTHEAGAGFRKACAKHANHCESRMASCPIGQVCGLDKDRREICMAKNGETARAIANKDASPSRSAALWHRTGRVCKLIQKHMVNFVKCKQEKTKIILKTSINVPFFKSKYDFSAQATLDMCHSEGSGKTATFSGEVHYNNKKRTLAEVPLSHKVTWQAITGNETKNFRLGNVSDLVFTAGLDVKDKLYLHFNMASCIKFKYSFSELMGEEAQRDERGCSTRYDDVDILVPITNYAFEGLCNFPAEEVAIAEGDQDVDAGEGDEEDDEDDEDDEEDDDDEEDE